jgi:hypothetical protein
MLKPTKLTVIASIVLLTSATGCAVTNKISKKFIQNPSTLALADHLQQKGAKMYGTYWCLACQGQKKAFGKQAFNKINYIECDPAGKNPQTNLCKQAKVTGFPTWQIDGKLSCQGGCTLNNLADLSGYKGDRNFGQ